MPHGIIELNSDQVQGLKKISNLWSIDNACSIYTINDHLFVQWNDKDGTRQTREIDKLGRVRFTALGNDD
jgi:hypothetical protein